MNQQNRVLKYGNEFHCANIAAEPIDPNTLEMMQSIGIPRSAINPTYGLAETGAYVTSCQGDEISILDGVVSCGRILTNEAMDKYVVIANEERGAF